MGQCKATGALTNSVFCAIFRAINCVYMRDRPRGGEPGMRDKSKDKKEGDGAEKPKTSRESVLPPPIARSPDRGPDAGKAPPEDIEAAADAAADIAARAEVGEPPSPDDAPPAPDGEPGDVEVGELGELEPMDGESSKLEKMKQLGKAGWDKSSGARGMGLAGVDLTGRVGWSATKLAGRTAARVVDRAGWGLDKFSDWLLRQSAKINGGKPVFGVQLLTKGIGWVQEKTGFKKRLGETLKENKEERKKLAKKIYDQMIKDEQKWEKDQLTKSKKAKREAKIKKRFGDEAGALLIEEFPDEHKNLDKDDDEPATPDAPAAAA